MARTIVRMADMDMKEEWLIDRALVPSLDAIALADNFGGEAGRHR